MDFILKLFLTLSDKQQLLLKNELIERGGELFPYSEALISHAKEWENLPDESIAELLGLDTNSGTYARLKTIMLRDLTAVMVIDFTTEERFPLFMQKQFLTNRMIIGARRLMSTGHIDLGRELLKRAASEAKRYELLFEKLQSEYFFAEHMGVAHGISAFDKHNKSFNLNMLLLGDIFRAEEINRRIIIGASKKGAKPSAAKIKPMLDELTQIHNRSQLDKVAYYYHFTYLYYYQVINDYPNALSHAMSMLELVTKSPAIKSDLRQGNAYIQLADLHVQMEEFNEGETLAQKAVGFFNKRSINHFIAHETLFLAQLNLRRFDDAQSTIDYMLKFKGIEQYSFRKNKWLLFSAMVSFSRSDYSVALRKLSQVGELQQDKDGWNLGMRLYEILALIQADDLETIEYRMETLRKTLEALKMTRKQERISIIYRILQLGRKKDFKSLSAEELRLIKELDATEEPMRWNPTGFEVIRFDTWYLTEVKRKDKVRT
jgi:tetratricopeptide (TPR) repeat protein